MLGVGKIVSMGSVGQTLDQNTVTVGEIIA